METIAYAAAAAAPCFAAAAYAARRLARALRAPRYTGAARPGAALRAYGLEPLPATRYAAGSGAPKARYSGRVAR